MKLALIVFVVLAGAAIVFFLTKKRECVAKGSGQSFEIVQCETKATDSPTGRKAVILLAANIQEAAAQEDLVRAMIQKFLLQRMISPPDTSLLLVTIVGPCDRRVFAARWRELAAADKAISVFMARMEKADVGVTPASGSVVAEFESLLPK